MVSNLNNAYKVRTLLDSGSGANWITREILNHVKFAKKGNVTLKIHHWGGSKQKRFEIVQIYLDTSSCTLDRLPTHVGGNDRGNLENKISLTCLVIDEFTFHRIVPNMRQFLRSTGEIDETIINQVVEPSSEDISHKNLSLGSGLIICNTGRALITDKSHNIVLSNHNLLIEQTMFGYAISGKIPESLLKDTKDLQANQSIPVIAYRAEVNCVTETFQGYEETLSPEYGGLDHITRILWEKELSLGVMKGETHSNDEKAVDLFKEGISFDENESQFVTKLPFNGKEEFLSDNMKSTIVRTYGQNNKMAKFKDYLTGSVGAMDKMISTRSVEKVTPDMGEGSIVHYLPWRMVVKTESETTTYRMCMDASARPRKGELSLNDCLLQGPNMTLNLAKCLIRFMLGQYRAVGDFEKAFLMILIDDMHRDALRFFWPEEPGNPNSRLQIWRFRVVLFGSISSPFLLAAVLDKIINEDIKDKMLQKLLLESIYVDNLACSSFNKDMIFKVYATRKNFLNRHFNLRMWKTNVPEVNKMAKEDGVLDDRENIPVLGKIWEKGDVFAFKPMKEWDGNYTKLSTLSFGNGPFDPTGELCPLLVQIRALIRELWKEKYDWKTSYADKQDLVKRFDQLREDVKVALTRKSKVKAMVVKETQLHIFSDASQAALGAVLYLVTPPCESCPEGQVKQVMAKSKLTPPLGERSSVEDTMPRWELLGMLISAQIAWFVTSDIDLLQDKEIFLWGDSKVALHWCSSDNPKDNFVIRRVNTIRKLVPRAHLRYVNTSDNPADIITRPIKGQELLDSNLWWEGPSWLKYPEKWPKQEYEFKLQTEFSQEVQMSLCNISKKKSRKSSTGKRKRKNKKYQHESFSLMSLWFSSMPYMKALKTLRWAIRWRDRKRISLTRLTEYNLHQNPSNVNHFSYEEKMYVVTEAYKIMQQLCFPSVVQTLSNGKLVKEGRFRTWGLHLDNRGVIRCSASRVTENMEGVQCLPPVLVHGDHPMIQGYLRHRHLRDNCCGVNSMKNNVKFYINGVNVNVAINKTIRECRKCAVVRAQPYSYPEFVPLPIERLRARKPFTCVGVDYSGPHVVSVRYRKVKVYVCLFTCFVTRGIYLVQVDSLEAKDFMDAFLSLVTRRGYPEHLLSDNATNFIGTNNVLKEIANDKKVVEKLNEHGIVWKFTPPNAPWCGGIYERLIGSMKGELQKMTNKGLFSKTDFCRHLLEIESLLNSRPLCKVQGDKIITPAHFLGIQNDHDPNVTYVDKVQFLQEAIRSRDNINVLHQDTERLREKFWIALWAQYLDNLRFSRTNTGNRHTREPKVNDVCIIWDASPRNNWKKAVITELIKSEDNNIRSCRVKTAKGEMIRPVNMLYSLELTEDMPETRSFCITEIINEKSTSNSQNTSSLQKDLVQEPNTHSKQPEVRNHRAAKVKALEKLRTKPKRWIYEEKDKSRKGCPK